MTHSTTRKREKESGWRNKMLIDSENLIARIDKCYQESAKTGLGLEPVMAIRDIKALISVMPTVDAVPVKHGRWINMKNGNADCSVCGRHVVSVYDDDNADRFCRCCGAKVDLT
jgi:hypothetical protein